MHPNWGPYPQPGIGPDWESNWLPFVLKVDTQPTEPDQSGLTTANFYDYGVYYFTFVNLGFLIYVS